MAGPLTTPKHPVRFPVAPWRAARARIASLAAFATLTILVTLAPLARAGGDDAKSEIAALGVEEFERLHRELTPDGPDVKEPWETIGWRTDLLAARDEAAKAGKPLFLWAMNGHPLGCT
jgi:hypothetical protein